MTAKFKQSWNLFKASLTVTLRHRKLLWFPFLTGLATAFIALFFLSAIALPFALHPTGYHLYQKEHWVALGHLYSPPSPAHSPAKPPGTNAIRALTALVTGQNMPPGQTGHTTTLNRWISLDFVALYLISMFLATFFNVAFYSEIIAALDGRGVSFRRGLQTARKRLPAILAWSLLAGTVGWLIRAVEQRLPLAGRIMAGLIGLAWSIAAVFAIPVIIRDQSTHNPVDILRQSALTLRRTWGEGLIGYIGFASGSWVIFLGTLLLLLPGIGVAAALGSKALMMGIFFLWILALLSAAYVSSVARHVYRCALFKYATEGVVPEPYDRDLLDKAWKVRKKSAE